jgi:hypothetical protein
MKRATKYPASTVLSRLAALLLLATGAAAFATDTYNGGALSIPSATVGGATFTNLVVTVQNVLAGPTGAVPGGSADSYNPVNNQLTIPSVRVGAMTYYNVVVSVGSLISAQGVAGADTYDGTHLTLPAVQVGARIYTGVVLAVNPANVVKVGSGMPSVAVDQYNPSTGQLLLAAVAVGSHVYTNVTLSVTSANIRTVGGAEAAAFTVGGRVVGLGGSGNVQVRNGNDVLSVSANGSFSLPAPVASGGAYSVSIGATPANQICIVQPGTGSGAVAAANVTNVLVYCTYIQSVATLNGSYAGAGYNINMDTDGVGAGVPFDGAGNQGNPTTLIVNSGGTISTTSTGFISASPYTVVTTNAIPVLTDGGNNIGAIAGADADEFFWLADASTADGGGLPALAVWVNPLQHGTIAALAGNWFVAGLEQGSDPADFEGVLTIGADGSLSGTSTGLDVNGVVSANPQSGPAGTITVTSSGQFSDSGRQLGYFSANGEFLVATRTTSGEPTGLTVLVKQGTGVTLATLNGVYTVGSLSFSTAATGDGEVSTLFFDGAGNFSGTYIDNNSGTITTGYTTSGTYSVTSTGVLTLTPASGNVHTGGVSADGNIIVAANLTAGGAEAPRIFVGFRQ